MSQYAGEPSYRLLGDRLYRAERYNTLTGALPGNADVRVTRSHLGAGWFLTRNMPLKSEWVRQTHDDFIASDIWNGGRFRELMMEATVSF